MSRQRILNLNNDPIIKAKGITLDLNGQTIFQDLDFYLYPGEAYLLGGASGSGKTLLLKILSGLIRPASGSVELKGININKAGPEVLQQLRINMGFVFQDAALISNMCLYDNIALPLRYHTSLSESELKIKVGQMMSLFQLHHQYDFFLPAQLSLEVRKRAALARALILDPELLFLDEPTSGLGTSASIYIWQVLQEYRQRRKASLIFVECAWPSACRFADRIGFLKGGKIVAEGRAEEIKDYLEKTARDENSLAGIKEQAYEDVFSDQAY